MSCCCVTLFLELGRRSGEKTGALAQSQPVFRPDCKHLLLTLSLQENHIRCGRNRHMARVVRVPGLGHPTNPFGARNAKCATRSYRQL